MPSRPSAPSRSMRSAVLFAATGVAALAAALAPVSLTGNVVVDVVERALIAGGAAFVGAHGRRWSWIVAAALIAAPARGEALAITLAALIVLVAASAPRRRAKDIGAVGLGLLVNVPFWYEANALPLGPPLAIAGFAILVGSGMPHLRRRRRRALSASLLVMAGIVAVAVAGTGISVLLARSAVSDGTAQARQALKAARNGDADASAAALARARGSFGSAVSRLDGVATAPASLVPGLAQQVRAVQAAVHEGRRITATADDVVATANYDELTYSGRIDLGQVDALAGPTRRTNRVLEQAAGHLDRVRAGWLLPPLNDRLDQFAGDLADARRDTDLASEMLDLTPTLFGGHGPRRYLVAFITPAELRGAGGFIGSYAELTAIDGKVRLTRSGRIRELIDGAPPDTRRLHGPPDYVRRYARIHPTDALQDITVSPDFPSDASVLQQLYPQSGGLPIDGVIGVDPSGLAALLKLTGPITVPGLDGSLNARNAEEVLLRSQYLSLPDEAERNEILSEAIRATFEKLTNSSLPAPRAIAHALSDPTRSGHLRLWSPDKAEEALFERLGADGALAIPKGSDGFSVVQQNDGQNKLDAYLHRTIAYHATVDADTGALKARLSIELRNDPPGLDLPRAVVGNVRGAPVGTNVAHLSIYTRQHLASATIDGVPVKLGPDRELGLNVYDTADLRIPPGGVVKIVLELEGGVDLTNGYDLQILPQPVANPDRMSATLSLRNGTLGAAGSTDATLLSERPITRPTRRQVRVRD